MKRLVLTLLLLVFAMSLVACTSAPTQEEPATSTTDAPSSQLTQPAPTLTLVYHSGVKLKTSAGQVIYIDPSPATAAFSEAGDYSEPADIILITHEHADHNNPDICEQSEDCVIITWEQALTGDGYQTFTLGIADELITVTAVPAANSNHSIDRCVGYIVEFNGFKVYHAGDTSTLDSMSQLSQMELDYALYPVDGVYNMGAAEASTVAETVDAAHSIPMHMFGNTPEENGTIAAGFTPAGMIYCEYGETISLEK